jgi:hypothetical protein
MSWIAWAAQQSFVKYEAGFKHPVPLKGRLKTLDLSMSLVNAADRMWDRHPACLGCGEIVDNHSRSVLSQKK